MPYLGVEEERPGSPSQPDPTLGDFDLRETPPGASKKRKGTIEQAESSNAEGAWSATSDSSSNKKTEGREKKQKEKASLPQTPEEKGGLGAHRREKSESADLRRPSKIDTNCIFFLH